MGRWGILVPVSSQVIMAPGQSSPRDLSEWLTWLCPGGVLLNKGLSSKAT